MEQKFGIFKSIVSTMLSLSTRLSNKEVELILVSLTLLGQVRQSWPPSLQILHFLLFSILSNAEGSRLADDVFLLLLKLKGWPLWDTILGSRIKGVEPFTKREICLWTCSFWLKGNFWYLALNPCNKSSMGSFSSTSLVIDKVTSSILYCVCISSSCNTSSLFLSFYVYKKGPLLSKIDLYIWVRNSRMLPIHIAYEFLPMQTQKHYNKLFKKRNAKFTWHTNSLTIKFCFNLLKLIVNCLIYFIFHSAKITCRDLKIPLKHCMCTFSSWSNTISKVCAFFCPCFNKVLLEWKPSPSNIIKNHRIPLTR